MRGLAPARTFAECTREGAILPLSRRTKENSPAFQRWVCAAAGISPEGTAEAAALSRPFGTRALWLRSQR
jgi:hypothetical protein